MSEWTIYSKSGAAKAVVHELEYHGEWMGDEFVTVNVKSAVPVDFAVGDYIDYRDERYVIEYDPTVLKKAKSGSYGEGFTYDNIKFVNKAQAEIVRCDFTDIVLGDNKQHYTSLPTFPFYCETVDDLLDRIQANLQELYGNACQFILIGLNRARASERGRLVGRQQAFEAAFDQYVGSSTSDYGKKGVALTVDNITCWDALTKVHLDFGLNFIQRGYVVVVGTAGFFTANTFTYGKGNGLYEIEKIGDSEQQIVTRLRAYGSETNLPINYYANLHKKMYTTGVKDTIGSDGSYTAYGIKTRTLYSAIHPATNNDINITLEYNNRTVKANCDGYTEDGTKYVWWYFSEADHALSKAFYDALPDGEVKVYVISGAKKEKWPSNLVEVSGDYDYPANLVMNRLMLPGFPDTDLRTWVSQNRPSLLAEGFEFSTNAERPYIDSPNTALYGIRPGSIYFDGSNDTDDIHPTITGSGYDEIVSATQVNDTGVYDTTEPDPITIVIPGMNGFALDEAWKQGASIDITDGMCGGRSFEVTKTPKKVDGNWQCTCKRSYDDTLHLWFPYSDFQINANNRHDKFVLTGIDLPDAYVTLASERLFDAAIAALRKNDAPRFTFQPRIDEIWMQRQDDMAHANHITSIHDTLKAGDIFRFADADVLGVDGNDQPIVNSIIIDVLTIKENGNNGIPTYEVTLRDEKQISTIQKIANKVDSLANGGNGSGSGGGGGSSMTAAQMESLIPSEGAKYFLSKISDDIANGIITFVKGIKIGAQKLFGWDSDGNIVANIISAVQGIIDHIQSPNYTAGELTGTGWKLTDDDGNGNSRLEVDTIVARMRFIVNELMVRKYVAMGGNYVFSPAASQIESVDYLDANGNLLGYEYTKAPLLARIGGMVKVLLFGANKNVMAVKRYVKNSDSIDPTQVATYRCWIKADDGTTRTVNSWASGMLARCQTADIAEIKGRTENDSGTQGDVGGKGNVFYWRLATSAGQGPLPISDGKIHSFVDLSNVSGEYLGDSMAPQAGDDIVCFGATREEYSHLIIIETTGQDAPAIKEYNRVGLYDDGREGINWSLDGKMVTKISPRGNVFNSDFFKIRVNNEDMSMDAFFDMKVDEIHIGVANVDGLQAELNLKATTASLNTTRGEIEMAGIHLDGVNGYINTRASKFTLTNLDDEQVLGVDSGGNLEIKGALLSHRVKLLTSTGTTNLFSVKGNDTLLRTHSASYDDYYGLDACRLLYDQVYIGVVNSGNNYIEILLPPPHLFIGQRIVITNDTQGFPISNPGDKLITVGISYMEYDNVKQGYISLVGTEAWFDERDGSHTDSNPVSGKPYFLPPWEEGHGYKGVCGMWKGGIAATPGNRPVFYVDVKDRLVINAYKWVEFTAVKGDFVDKYKGTSNWQDSMIYNAYWMLTRWEDKTSD